MNHLDLFSGIGGFAYAVDQVWPGSNHVFCDNDKFCQEVIKKHWPNSDIYDDIRGITFNTISNEHIPQGGQVSEKDGVSKVGRQTLDTWRVSGAVGFLTGGFPCQPFSTAGKRRGTEDDRYLWPEMFRVIQLTTPTWIIGENVGGFVTWNEGLVLEKVCTDLENEGYEVQPFIIPACSVNAPHRRDRVWIVAHRNNPGSRTPPSEIVTNGKANSQERKHPQLGSSRPNWNQDWLEVATRLCRMDDGLPRRVDRLKALGNAIVPQVAIEIMKAIKIAEGYAKGN